MERTPIRIRGRRKRKVLSDSPDVSPKNSPRPRKVARLNFAGLQALKTKKIRRDPSLSFIEQLPTELVLVIFEYCNNISLPLSSPIFTQKLSHRKTYLRFALEILSVPHSEDGADTDQPADATVVSRMLECKWMTWDMMQTIIKELHKRTQTNSSNESVDDQQDIPTPNFDSPHLQPKLSYLNLHHSIQIPQKLLQSPFTTEKTDFLKYLIWNGCSINWTQSSRGEIATSGLQDAISSNNELALSLLLSPAINVVPDTQTLRSAALTHNASPTTLFHLLSAVIRTSILSRTSSSIPPPDFNFRDPAIWSWGVRVAKTGSGKGTWLLDALRVAGAIVERESTWDEHVFAEFKRAVCGREGEEGFDVTVFDVPLV